MLNTNIVPFQPQTASRATLASPAPFWPTQSLHDVVRKMRTNIIVEHERHLYYKFKPDISGKYLRIVIHSSGLWEHTSTDQEQVSAFKTWITEQRPLVAKLVHQLQGQGLCYDIYGKMGTVAGKVMFCVYYVIVDSLIIFGSNGLSTLLIRETSDAEAWYIVEESKEVLVDFSFNSDGAVRCPQLADLRRGQRVIGFPITTAERDTTSKGIFFAIGCTYQKSFLQVTKGQENADKSPPV